MRKFFYFYLAYTITICFLFVSQGSSNSLPTLQYIYEVEESIKLIGQIHSEKMEKFERNFFKQKINRNITIYKIPLEKIYSNQLANQSLLSMSFMKNGGNINKNVFKPTFDDKTPEQLSGNTDKFFCSLKYCEIGIMFQKVGSSELNSVDLHKVDNVFYIGFGKIDKYDSLILMKLLRHHDKHTFHVVVCPVEDWIQENSLAEYIVDMENVVDFPKQEKLTLFNFYKILICQKNNVKTFAKCGHINQLYMPPVDVGYKCDKRVVDDDEKNNSTYHRANIDSNYQITYEGKNLLKSTYATYLALSPEKNYKSNITEVNFYNYKSKFYSGQRLIYGIYKEYHKNEDNFGKSTRGYTYTYHAKYLLPEIYATLRLKINGVIQKFLNKIDENFGKIDVYTFDRREIKDAPMGCHAVPDKITYPAFNDFYERRYSTLLLIFDETAQQYKKVHNIQGLVSNKKYKCILIIKGSNSKTKKPNFIKETEFVINFIDEISPIWIIFVVLVIITVLLIVGFIILKRLQLKKKKSNDSLSTSSSKSKTKSLTVTSKVPKVPTTQKKNAFKTYMNIAKTMVTKNWNTNNKVTNFGQKVVGKNSNLINQIQNGTKNVVAKNSNLNLTNQTQNATKNVAGKNPNLNLTNQTQNATKNVIAKNPNINLVNQVKNTPKKIAVKNTNQKKISNVGDSVFKLK